jgi:hypothetical protein
MRKPAERRVTPSSGGATLGSIARDRPGVREETLSDTSVIETNAALVRTITDAFLRGDLATVASQFAADAVWELPGRSALASEHKGPDAIRGFLARSFELSGGTLRLEVLDILASTRGAAHVQRVTADPPRTPAGLRRGDRPEIVDGPIVRTYHRPDIPALDAFLG